MECCKLLPISYAFIWCLKALKYSRLLWLAAVRIARWALSLEASLFKDGYKEIDVLRRIAAEIAQLELGNALIRLKELGDSQIVSTAKETPPVAATAYRNSKLDHVDREAVLSYGERIKKMIFEQSGGKFKVGELRADGHHQKSG